MNFLKKLKNMDRQVLILIAVCVLILLVVLFYPRKQQTGVKLVPVKGTSYYQAVFENMQNQNKGQIVFSWISILVCLHLPVISKHLHNNITVFHTNSHTYLK